MIEHTGEFVVVDHSNTVKVMSLVDLYKHLEKLGLEPPNVLSVASN